MHMVDAIAYPTWREPLARLGFAPFWGRACVLRALWVPSRVSLLPPPWSL